MKVKPIYAGLGAFAIIPILYTYYQANRKDVPIYFRKSLFNNYNARTIPPFGIYIKETQKDNKELIEHEITHWKQFQDKGLINFYLDYLKQLNKHGYDDMPMEKQARKNENQYCINNYTDCVRTGKASTVYNPNFRKKATL